MIQMVHKIAFQPNLNKTKSNTNNWKTSFSKDNMPNENIHYDLFEQYILNLYLITKK